MPPVPVCLLAAVCSSLPGGAMLSAAQPAPSRLTVSPTLLRSCSRPLPPATAAPSWPSAIPDQPAEFRGFRHHADHTATDPGGGHRTRSCATSMPERSDSWSKSSPSAESKDGSAHGESMRGPATPLPTRGASRWSAVCLSSPVCIVSSLNTATEYDINNLVVRAPDLAIDMPSGRAFLASTPDGPTAMVLLGRGRMTFSPPDPAERTQIHILSGRDELVEEIDMAFLRFSPYQFGSQSSTRTR